MPERTDSRADNNAAQGSESNPSCSCVRDPFASLPPELQPKPQPKKGGLRQATCPGCGLEFWTSRKTDFCLDCERGGTCWG